MSVGLRISRLRLERGESLQDVADAVGVSKAHIWEMEKGRASNPSMDLVTRLGDHFEVSVSFLVGEDRDADDAEVALARMFRQAKKLTQNERKILDQMMQSLLANRPKSVGSKRA